MGELEDYHRSRGLKILAKLGRQHYVNMARASYKKRTKGMTKEQISDYFRKIRAGKTNT